MFFSDRQTVFLPITGIELDGCDSWQRGPITLHRTTDAFLQTFGAGKVADIGYIQKSSEARVWAECSFVAEPKRSQILAVELCGRLVDVLRFWMAATSAQKNFPVGIALEGDFANGSRMQIVRGPDGGIIWDHSPARGLAPLAIGARLMEVAQPAHCLLDFAFEPAKQTKFCKLIMHAVRSFGKGKVSPHGEDRVLGYMIALEAFLNEKNIPLTESVSEGAATILGGPIETRLELKKDLKRIYGYRSQIAHGESMDNLDPDDVRLLENTVISFVLAMIAMRAQFSSKKDLLAALERNRMS